MVVLFENQSVNKEKKHACNFNFGVDFNNNTMNIYTWDKNQESCIKIWWHISHPFGHRVRDEKKMNFNMKYKLSSS